MLVRAGVRLVIAAFAFVIAFGRDAAAQPPPAPNAVAVHVEGLDAKAVREDVVAALPRELTVIEAAAFAKALRGAGQRGDLGNAVTLSARRTKLLDRVRAAGREAGADAVVVGRARRGKKGAKEVWLLVVRPETTGVEIDRAVELVADRDERRAELGRALDPALHDLLPAPPPPPKKEEPPAPVEPAPEPAPERVKHEVPTELFEVGLGFMLGGRFFDYADRITDNLRAYDVFGAPGFAIHGEVYPAAGTRIPVVRDLGVTAEYAMALGLDSQTSDGTTIGTTWNRLAVGLRARLRTGEGWAPTLGLSGRFGMARFGFEEGTAIDDELPSVSYTFLRAGLDARVPVGRVAFGLGVGYLGMLSSGDVYDRFRDASVGAIDLGAALSVAVAAGFEARLRGDYTRIFYAFGPEPGDEHAAGGALDEMLAFELGVAYVY